MKNNLALFLNLFCIVLFSLCLNTNSFSQNEKEAKVLCNPKPLIKINKKAFKPYQLDSYTENIISFDKKAKSTEVVFTAYAGDLYQLLFCGNNLPQEIELHVFDKNAKAKTRKEVFSGVLKQGDDQLGPFQPVKPGSYFITYKIPQSTDTSEVIKGCIVTLIGFKEKEEPKKR